MRDEDACLVAQDALWPDHLVENPLPHVAVHCTQRVVEQVDVVVLVDCPRQRYPGLLTAREVDSLLAYLRRIVVWEESLKIELYSLTSCFSENCK